MRSLRKRKLSIAISFVSAARDLVCDDSAVRSLKQWMTPCDSFELSRSESTNLQKSTVTFQKFTANFKKFTANFYKFTVKFSEPPSRFA